MNERYGLAIERIRTIVTEDTVNEKYRDYFQSLANFILEIDAIKNRLETKPNDICTLEELKNENASIYRDVLSENYEMSFANPSYATAKMGDEIGQILSFLYAEIRSEIPYVYEKRMEYLTICNELFIEVYNCFEGVDEPDIEELKSIIYWYASDYCDVFMTDRIEEQVNPECRFATDIVMNSNLEDLSYLYYYGEFVSKNEIETARHLNSLPQEVIDRMAEVYTEGYR
ncbi:MAG: leucyl aminopeptidase, partial [Faecalimonas sp.]|nr:leucyl aminopeptidase [Faecalimonas sp.]